MNENDLVWVSYTTRDANSKEIIENRSENPIIIQLKTSNLPKKVKEAIKDMKEGEEKEIEVSHPFGYREKDLINIVSLKQFRENKVNPFPGLVVDLPRLLYLIRIGLSIRSMVAGDILSNALTTFKGNPPNS